MSGIATFDRENQMLGKWTLVLLSACLLSTNPLHAQRPVPLAPGDEVLALTLAAGEPPLHVTLARVMRIFHEPGFSVAIIRALRNAATALTYYQHARSAGVAGLRHDATTLNNFGYSLLGDRQFADAIRAFRLNVVEYPQDANGYDSLGEAYMDAGERALAIVNYQRSLDLDPKNANAVARLKQLRGGR